MKKLITTIITLALTIAATAQVHVETSIDSVAILIGQQTQLQLKVTAPRGSRIVFPTFKPTQYLVPGLEVLSSEVSDSAQTDGDLIEITRSYTLTSFDEALYPIKGLSVKVNGKPYPAPTAALKVLTIDVDTLHPNQFFPPKDVQDNPFLWAEWRPLIWLSIVFVLLLLTGFYMLVRLRQHKPIIAHLRIVKHIPAHQKALTAIEKIKQDRLVGSEDQKLYYTQLTDTIRQYIRERFGFNAMEMTSSEIIARLQNEGDRKMIDELTELFTTADLVKFAKYSTLINENDLNLVNAVNFIDQTKTDQKPTEEVVKPQLSTADEQAQRSRKMIKAALWAIAATATAIIVYLTYQVISIIS